MTDTVEAPTSNRGAALLATRQTKMDSLFGEGRQYEIVKEVHLTKDEGTFTTPFGNKGRNGYVVRRTVGPVVDGVEGVDDSRGFIVGEHMLREMAEQYQAVTVPDRPRKRRTPAQKAADDAAAAELKVAQATE